MNKYETTAGYVTRQDTNAKIMELMRELEDCFYLMSHLHRTEIGHTDETIASGWRGMGQLMSRARAQVMKLAMGKLQ